ncbi:27735_t:CDS:2 [Dentiscutata erythropus]|uniref:27735_t:CDS:1 n=1 Tax=Dentiscutata erythropus TaxID=1348616 RepID=A0A9N9P3J6_9GLOM|nr:27735_t:CDS:2 [Dentiscutata erythropus]
MSLRQKEEGDLNWRMDIHCCFCKRATKLKDLLPFNINNKCAKPMLVKRTKTNSPEIKKNVYANRPTYNLGRSFITKEENQREYEETARSKHCTPICQYFDYKKLKDEEIHIFNVNTTMIHDRKYCSHGAVKYDEAGIEYSICTCYRETSKYCAEYKHATNPCKCKPEVFWEIRFFAGKKCRWVQCEHHLEYMHCEHLYCWKHKQYIFNKYTKCLKCKDELGITGNEYWEKLVINIIEFKKKMKLIGGHKRVVFEETKEEKELREQQEKEFKEKQELQK